MSPATSLSPFSLSTARQGTSGNADFFSHLKKWEPSQTSWLNCPGELLYTICRKGHALAAARLVCRLWKRNLDANVVALAPNRSKTTNAHFQRIAADFHLVQCLDLDSCHKLTSSGIGALTALKNLQELYLTNCWQLKGSSLNAISGLTALTLLDLSQCCQVASSELKKVRHLQRLESLHLEQCTALSCEVGREIGRLTRLTRLDIANARGVVDKTIECFTSLKRLAHLDAASCGECTNVGLGFVGTMTTLTYLDISNWAKCTDAGFTALGQLLKLSTLHLADCAQLTGNGLTPFSQLHHLQWLDIAKCRQLSSQSPQSIGTLTQLHALSLCDFQGACHILKPLKELTRLDIANCDLRQGQVALTINRWAQLKSLQLSVCRGLSSYHLDEICAFGQLSHLEISLEASMVFSPFHYLRDLKALLVDLRLTGNNFVGDADCLHLGALTGLTQLDLKDFESVTDCGLAALSHLRRLRNLTLRRFDAITGSGLAALANTRRLKILTATGANLEDAQIALAQLPRSLRSIQLQGLHLSGGILPQLYRMHCLEILELPDLFKALARSLRFLRKIPRLSALNLQNGNLGDTEVIALNKIANLSRLDLSRNPRITAKGLKTLGTLTCLAELKLTNCYRVASFSATALGLRDVRILR